MYETSRKVAETAFTAVPTPQCWRPGRNFADALSAGAGSRHGPVILVDGTASNLDAATSQALKDLKVKEIVIVGGEASVTPGILADA